MWSSAIHAALVTACVANTTDPADPVDPPPPVDPVDTSTFHDCRGRAFEPAPEQGWRHDIATPLVTAVGDPNHAGRDLVVKSSSGVELAGKFTYGTIAKDLQDEDVRVSIDDCTGWQTLGDFTTDSNGEIHAALARSLDIGAYAVAYQVLGDQSTTFATLWILPAGTHLVITDIDGTLTSSDSELFKQILDGSHVPVAYPGAVDLTTAHEERGEIVLYLTGRPDWLNNQSRGWLADQGFSAGALRLTDSNSQILPTEGSVGDFKKSVIAKLQADGYIVDAAYGNASTDIYAYLGAGLDPKDVYIIGTHGGEQGTHAATEWTARAAEVAGGPRVTQPFAR